VLSSFKNYSDEIKLFLDWIHPYTEGCEYVGYYRYEVNEDPTLIYREDDGFNFVKVNK
jgi:hypothetical protein